MQIGILQTGHAPDAVAAEFGDYHAFFTRLLDGEGFTFRIWDVVDIDFPASVTEADGWLLTGSPHGAYEDHPFIPPLEDFIRDVHAAKVPMIGICFGHQVIAQALGGKVVKYEGGWNIGRREYDMGGKTVTLNAWHQDQVIEAPAGARIVASHAECANAGMMIGDTIFTLQPHPEIDQPILASYLRLLRGKRPGAEAQMDAAIEMLGQPTDEPDMGRTMAAFFRGQVPA